MPTRTNNSTQYENRQRAIELQNAATHTHRVAEQKRGKQEHLSPHEQTRIASEHFGETDRSPETATTGHGVFAFSHDDIAARAYSLWEARGCPDGSPEVDWFHAVKELRSMASPAARA